MKNQLFKKELLAIFKNKKLLIPILAVLFIPVLYSGMFLWAFWDPYDHLKDLPVAIVNNDHGADFEDDKLTLGKDLVDKLKESDDFHFIFVDKEIGVNGLKNQEYYMLVEIPENFSENATTLLDDSPQKLSLIYKPNEGYNFLSAQIGSTAIEKIKSSLSEKITETYSETIFDKIKDLSNGIAEASDGANKLYEGSLKLKDGSTDLQDGLATLAEKSIEFNEGIMKIDNGGNELNSGVGNLSTGMSLLDENYQKLEDASSKLVLGSAKIQDGFQSAVAGIDELKGKTPSLIAGTEQLEGGATKLSSSVNQWQTGANATAVGAEKVSAGLNALNQQMEQLLANNTTIPAEQKVALQMTMKQLLVGSQQVAAGTSQLSESAKKIDEGSTALAMNLSKLKQGELQLLQGVNQLAAGSSQLNNGLGEYVSGQKQFHEGVTLFGTKLSEAKAGSTELANGSKQLSSALNKLAEGSHALQDGVGKLKDGSEKLNEGNIELSSGANDLATGLTDGAEETSKFKPTEKTSEMMGSPVEIKNEKINKVPNYGTGFAPYFLSLGLFVGALLLSIVFPLREPADVPKNGWSWFISKFGILAGIGVIQALIAAALLLFGLDLHVESIPLFLLFAIITSITFIALVQMLVTVLGDPGRFIAIIVLILQLTTSAGTFPLELIPNALQPINAILPMTYSVSGFKSVISSGDFNFMWQNASVLFGFLGSFMILTFSYFNFKHKRQFEVLSK
ncbi:YhgE/Pip family protein [Bacillus sp. CGMCC 1.16607]|uniref:YhgE/Pip family protein n=1 Tax=Bacillus sp. CGMCC 1.16607 TaxID=3351842 RepID=UPI00363F73AE